MGWVGISISKLPSQRHPLACGKCGGQSLLSKRQSWLLVLLTLGAALGTTLLLVGMVQKLKLPDFVQKTVPYVGWAAVAGVLPTPLFRLFFKLEPVTEGVWMTRNIPYRRLSWILSMVSAIWAIPSIHIGRMMWTGEIDPRHGSLSVGAWIVVGLGIVLVLVTACCWFVEKPTEKLKDIFVPNPLPKPQPQDTKQDQTIAKGQTHE